MIVGSMVRGLCFHVQLSSAKNARSINGGQSIRSCIPGEVFAGLRE